ncbi:MAG: hypothetical protein AAGJ18_01605 [Bacteroidota bacterium]
MKNLLLVLALFLTFQNCRKNTNIGANGQYLVDPVFEPYVQEFIAEGAKRGRTIDFSESGLIVEFSDGSVQTASGFCYIGEHHVVIDKSEWTSLSEDVRGFLLFHELGHCELDRGHKNVKFPNDVWQSIMRGSPLEGTEVWIPIPFFGFRKDYFIDELFDQNISAPAWANPNFPLTDIPTNRKEQIAFAENINRINERVSDIMGDYEIKVNFKRIVGRPNRTKFIWGNTTQHYYIDIFPDQGFNVSGYFIGVRKDNRDNGLFYSKNTININGEELNEITIRREDGFEKVFLNGEFIFHIDEQETPISLISMEATTSAGAIDTEFEVNSFEFNDID